jgi:hypothetical protein
MSRAIEPPMPWPSTTSGRGKVLDLPPQRLGVVGERLQRRVARSPAEAGQGHRLEAHVGVDERLDPGEAEPATAVAVHRDERDHVTLDRGHRARGRAVACRELRRCRPAMLNRAM